MSKKFEQLMAPFHLSAVRDGAGYQVARLYLSEPENLFTRIGFLGDLVVKIHSLDGWRAFSKSVRWGETSSENIRANEELERFENLDLAIQQFPAFGITRELFGDMRAHYLIVHYIQFTRLREANLVHTPDTRFIVLRWPMLRVFVQSEPAMLQQRIRGVRLWDMVDTVDGGFLPGFAHLKKCLAGQLGPLVESGLRAHIDWNIQNFILEEGTQHLYYIDSKPTTIAARQGTEHNLASLRETFLD
jgi:hypothetical protein